MNKKKFLNILNSWPKKYISPSHLKPILKCSNDMLFSHVKRSVKEGTLIRIKRDFYLISETNQKSKPDSFEIAALLYGPSYISFESALSYHEWIPEAVPTIISACSKKSKKIETPLGFFAYYKVPIEGFHFGISAAYKKISIKQKNNFLIADPWKAIADIIYIKKKRWKNIIALSNDMRIDLDLIQNSNLQLLEVLANNYPSKKVNKILKNLFKDLQK